MVFPQQHVGLCWPPHVGGAALVTVSSQPRRTVDELAEALAEVLGPHQPVPMPASLIKTWLTRPPLSSR